MWRDEKVSKRREDGDEALQAAWRSEALHHSLPFSKGKMRILSSIVQSLVRAMLDIRHDLSFRRSIRP
jgi:hypothetical protein